MREIEFHKNWWLKWYWEHIEPIYRTEGHFGTRQSGKTHNIGRKLIYHSFQEKKFNVVHTRKNYNQIEGSTFKVLKDIVTKNFPDDFTITKEHFSIVNKHTGNWFRGLGMDKPENAKSVEGANVAWMNEASQFTIDDYDYIDTTIRAASDCEISMILDWNPESIEHWLYNEVNTLSKKLNTAFIKSTFWDNYLIDRDELHEKLLNIKQRDPDGERKYKVWALGDWGVENNDMVFARDFNRDKHVTSENLYNPNEDIYLSFDLNYDPTCLIIQGWNVLKEYHIEGYTLPMILGLITAEYPARFPQVYVINGDVSGSHSRNISDNTTSYEIIKDTLSLAWDNFHVPNINPSHLSSRLLCNLALKNMPVTVHESCVGLISDMEQVKVDERGSLDVYKKNNPKRSHWLDSWRYSIHYEHYDLPKKMGLTDKNGINGLREAFSN